MCAAKKFDQATNQPYCEDPEKTGWMRSIGDHLGVYASI